MEQQAWINGQRYTLLEIVSSLDDGISFVLCENEQGKKCLCSEELWQSSAIEAERATLLNTHSSSQEKIKFFLAMFRGREDLYAKRYCSAKTGKSGYTPVCGNEWDPDLCDKKKYRCPDCPNRKFLPLTHEKVKEHLMGRDALGRDVVAIYPMLEDNTTWLLVADFDEGDWRKDVSAFWMCCKDVGLAPAVERSRSGDGAHVWFFFSEPVSAADARRLGSGLLTQAMARRHEISFSSYDRLFPSQDVVPKGGFGNLIALPFQGQAQKQGNTLFVNEQFEPYSDQWAFLSSLPKITPEQLAECLKQVCCDGDVGELVESEEKQAPWHRKRTRRKLTEKDFPAQVRLTTSNLIYIEKQGFSQPGLNALKRLAAFPNPEFRIKQAMRLPVYRTPRVLDCGYEDDDYIGIPRGCRDRLLDLLGQYGVPTMDNDLRCVGRSIDVSFWGTLRTEQEPAAQALLAEDMGVLSATTAFGKTVIGAYLIGQRKTNTLILVQSSALLEQWKRALEQFLDIREILPEQPKKRGRKKKLQLIGQMGGGKNARSGIIDIAIMQSMFEGEGKNVKDLVTEYGMVIVDECHHVAAFTFENVLKAVQARYVYGLSATPVRQDGHHPIIFMQCGPVRYLVDAKSQAEKRDFTHFVIPRFTRTRLPNANSIQDLYAGIAENDHRNALLADDALKVIQEGRTPILLTQRKEHAVRLAELIKNKVKNVFLLIGSDKPKDKREKLAALQAVPANEDMAVVATGKYIGEGFDSPRLDTLLLAMPISWKGTLAQYAGRLHRNYEGKHEVRIYDYVDVHIPTLERMYHKRLKGYAELGYQVKLGAGDSAACAIYDGHAAMDIFERDLSEVARKVVIVSPYMQKGRVSKLLPLLQELRLSDVAVTVHTRAEDSLDPKYQADMHKAITMVEKADVMVVRHEELQQRYAIFDGTVVWYGNVDLLAYGKKDADVLRFVNADIAGELLGLTEDTTGEQLTITEL